MSRPLRTLLTVLLCAVGLVVIHEWGPQGIYSFHHGYALYLAVKLLLTLLFLTHLGLAAIIWAQRSHWDQADASIFRFVAVKALFWCFITATAIEQAGFDFSTLYLFVVILFSTIDLDWQLARRYIFSVVDAATDVRLGDQSGTAAIHRRDERGA